jgi:superfamily II DNA or RNA helicase
MTDYKKRKNNYVDFKLNGRLFPSWVMANFSKYKLPEIVQTEDDPCFKKSKLELRKYQVFLGKYLDFNGPYKNMLIYYGVGAGKTASTINVYNMLYNYTPGWNVFLLIKATLKDHPWMADLKVWLQEDENKFRFQNIVFISYDSPIADKAFMDAIKNADSSKKSLYIIEEAHNFIRNVYGNISSKQGRRAVTIYDYIIQDQKENDGTRVLMLSGTPAINRPYELALLFNLLRPGAFPKSESTFNQEFVSNGSYRSINQAKKNMFQRRILGLVTYYLGATPDYFASSRTIYVDLEMSEYQNEIVSYFEDIEEKIDRKKRSSSSSSGTYKSYTRQSCNFAFPIMGQGISGETRPRPRNFKLSEKEGQNIEKAKSEIEKSNDKYYDVQVYLDAINNFITLFDEHLNKKKSEDNEKGHTIFDDVETLKTKYENDIIKFIRKEKKKSHLISEMYKCSAKMLQIIINILSSPGPTLVYSNYVLMEGLEIFKIYLKYFDFSLLNSDNPGKENFSYAEYHGGIDQKQRSKNIDIYNSKENKIGAICKIMMISPAGAEGISFYNIRQVHLMEPYWHEVRMVQMIGRAVRMCSHKDLPKKDRHVDIFRYKSVRDYEGKWTTDQQIEDMAKGKDGLIQSFLDAMKEASVDCELNKAHNHLVQDYKCFQFDEQSLFDDQIGPAYKEDMIDDEKINNGSNSINSKTIRIKALKIQAVKQMTHPSEEKIKYSKSTFYWYNQETGVVYDFDLHYVIGKVGHDEDGLPLKLDKDTYIIDKVVPIPMIDGE